MRTEEEFRKINMEDLLDELLQYQFGDGWDGMSSKAFYAEGQRCEKVFRERLKELITLGNSSYR